ncbi:uncharacterized protein LOC117317023 [Pecten maximus]|uniref:uncharacterized protein LOC117317023 n=1 Tax=Pecten maximus TaxID=6579 RepID=UPI00145817D1|nr:uncharacterized protein LOC117317023 [Pecten maximus]
MVNYCAMIGCNNTGGRDRVSFFRLPAVITSQGEKTHGLSEKRRRLWLTKISRADLEPSSYPYLRVCSEHFVSGKPSSLYPENSADWAPSLKLGHHKQTTVINPTPERESRLKGRVEKRRNVEAAQSLVALFNSKEVTTDHELDESEEAHPDVQMDTNRIGDEAEFDKSMQTEISSGNINAMESELNRLLVENIGLKEQLAASSITEDTFKADDEKVKFFTGLPSFAVLMTLFWFVEPEISCSHNSSLTKFQKMVLVLMRLKLNLPVTFLADKFKVSASTVSRTMLSVLNTLHIKLKPLIYWPTKEERRQTMPMEFRKYFGLKVAVIIDCFEVFIEKPSDLTARSQTWSSYKHHNTVKFLIGISPQGTIVFISDAYGGRASDKFITKDSEFLNKLEYGDVVLADRGFDIAEEVAQVNGEVRIPAFTKGKDQLAAVDVESTRRLAHVRIHVERVIGLVRNKYKIMHDTLPLDYFNSVDESTPTIDKIVTVCCALTNMCKSVVPFD